MFASFFRGGYPQQANKMGWFSKVTHAVAHPAATFKSAARTVDRAISNDIKMARKAAAKVERGAVAAVHTPVRYGKAHVRSVGGLPVPGELLSGVNRITTHVPPPPLPLHRLTTPADVSAFGGQAGIDARKGAVQDGPPKAPRPQINPDAVGVANKVIGGLEMAAMLPIVAGGAGVLLLVYLMSRN